MPESTAGPLRVTVLADSDTRWKWGALTARRIVPVPASGPASGVRLDGRLLRGRATPTPRQLAEVGIDADSLREVTAAEFLGETTRDTADVVVLACVGGTVQAMLHGLSRAWRGAARRPVVVTGYVGAVYEKLTDGLLLRAGADLVLANSAHDAQRFRAVYEGADADAAAGSVVETALPFLDGAPYAPSPDRPFTVVFATQPSVPDNRRDRMYLLRRAAEHARSHPGREVLVKLRSEPGEQTTHIEEQPYQKLVARLDPPAPANLRLVHGNMGEVLDRTDLLVTVSSTAALEAMHRAVPAAILTDLGIREPLGNHHFLGSGAYASWDRLDAGHVPLADPQWARAHGVAGRHRFAAVRDRVHALAGAAGLPPLTPYYTPAVAPGYLPGLLARHGLDHRGDPLTGSAAGSRAGSAVPGALRRAVRGAARTVYRQGVQRVAPLIRRWGQL